MSPRIETDSKRVLVSRPLRRSKWPDGYNEVHATAPATTTTQQATPPLIFQLNEICVVDKRPVSLLVKDYTEARLCR
jgi:hypothetical protein